MGHNCQTDAGNHVSVIDWMFILEGDNPEAGHVGR